MGTARRERKGLGDWDGIGRVMDVVLEGGGGGGGSWDLEGGIEVGVGLVAKDSLVCRCARLLFPHGPLPQQCDDNAGISLGTTRRQCAMGSSSFQLPSTD